MTTAEVNLAHDLLIKQGLQLGPEFLDVLDCHVREKIVTGGVRAGKSTEGAAELFTDWRFMAGQDERGKAALFWIVGPTYIGAHKEMEYLTRWCYSMGLIAKAQLPDDGPQRLELINGTIVETRTSQHPERLASDAPHKILVVEAGQQPPMVRPALLGRALENSAEIVYSGTLEDSDNKPRYGWYEELAELWRENPTDDHRTFSLPSWANLSEFPGGAADPKILYDRENLDEYTFARSRAGIAGGAQNPAYPQIAFGDSRLRDMPANLTWVVATGGADYGDVHPSALVVVTLSDERIYNVSELTPTQSHIAWVRECWWDGGLKTGNLAGDTAQFNAAKRRLSHDYNAWAWSVDPNERYMAGQMGGLTQAVQTGAGTRGARIGRVRARLNAGTLFFDKDGPGVRELYEEMRRVRYRRMANGELVLLRVDDDRAAALENAVDRLDGQEMATVEPSVSSSPYARKMSSKRARIGRA